MKGALVHLLRALVASTVISLVLPSETFGQSQALNGQIEGAVLDRNAASVPNASVIASNIETGATRTVTTDETGVYRMPLLPLGTYRMRAEAPGFRSLIRERITLTTGQSVTVDFRLEPGEVQETVLVSADGSIVDPGKTYIGRVVDSRDVKNLPLISRNPYNFAFLHPNVNGGTRPDFGFPRINANGYARRVNYLLDGNTNTQSDRAGVRLMFVSETYINEVQLITNAFAAEFGNTPGLIMNLVTPSGTNALRGTISYRFARTPFYARPFFYASPDDLPENDTDNFGATVGGPIVRDRWHFSASYEWIRREDKISRLVTILPADRDQLITAGLSPSIFVPAIPLTDDARFYFFRSDIQLNKSNRLMARFNLSNGIARNLIRGDLNTLERSIDSKSPDHSIAVQLASFTPRFLNEFRFQFAQRRTSSHSNDLSGSGPTVVIRDIANFGAPDSADTINPLEKVTQIQNNLTVTWKRHAVKIGGGFNVIDDLKRTAVFARYVFPSIPAYIAARNGSNPRLYSTYEETFGDPEIRYRSTFWNFFVQDDWKISRRLKLNIGLRYDLYKIPDADPDAPFPASRDFAVDANNFAPRLGIAYALDEGERPLVLRVGAGIYYDVPWLNMYERALLNNGNPRFFSFSMSSSAPGSPAFPAILGSLPTNLITPVRDIDTVSPDFNNMYATHFNVHLEKALTANLSAGVGFVHSSGRHIAVYRNVNVAGVERYLADGRPVFSSARLDPRFNVIRMAESAGNSNYNALSLQLTQRLSHGLQFSASYTLSKGTDDAPEQNLATAPFLNLVLSDPTDRRRDRGYSFGDQRHTFVSSLVYRTEFALRQKYLNAIINNNQVGLIVNANSGERFNIISGTDLNADGISSSDRPVGIKRNSGTTTPQFNIDLRYSRFFNFGERFKLELLADVQNVLNVQSIVAYSNVTVPTDPITGEIIGPLPDFEARGQSIGQESRQAQLGIKFYF